MTRLLGALDAVGRPANDAARALLADGWSSAEAAWPADPEAAAVLEHAIVASGIEIGLLDVSAVAGVSAPQSEGPLLAAIAAARRLLAGKLRVTVPAGAGRDAALDERLRDLADRADRRGLPLVVSVHGAAARIDELQDLLRAIEHPAISIEIEPPAGSRDARATSELIRQMLGRIGHVRVDLHRSSGHSASRLPDLLAELRGAGYHGSVTVVG
ncbi:MAG: hypothetical protein QOI52_769, partial [Chloroflexota bacterium]|nr:hypothetical protein [Chloroflexota bacterium]